MTLDDYTRVRYYSYRACEGMPVAALSARRASSKGYHPMADDWTPLTAEDVTRELADSLDDLLLASAGLEVESHSGNQMILKEIRTTAEVIKTGRYLVTVTEIAN